MHGWFDSLVATIIIFGIAGAVFLIPIVLLIMLID